MTKFMKPEPGEILLFQKIQYYRLLKDREFVNAKIKENETVAPVEKISLFKKVITKTKNSIKQEKTNKLNAQLEEINRQIAAFETKNAGHDYILTVGERLDTAIGELFDGKRESVKKLIFAAALTIDTEYEYFYAEESLKCVSSILYRDVERLSALARKTDRTCKELLGRSLPLTFKGTVSGNRTLAAVLLAANTAAATCASVIGHEEALTSLLGEYGYADAVSDMTLVALYEAFLHGIGFEENREAIVAHFRAMSQEDAAKLFALKCVLYEEAKNFCKEDALQSQMEHWLHMISAFKADTDHALFAERDRVDSMAEKVNLFHSLDKKLIQLSAL